MEQGSTQTPSNRILTIPNLISCIRLVMVPVYLVLLLNGEDLAAAVVFGVAAATDFLDGLIARATNSVSKLGQILDPAVDRTLMICGVLGVTLVGRLPLWIFVLVIIRDIGMLIAGGYLLKAWHVRVAVIYPGKVATTLFFVGFAFLILNWPIFEGMGITSATWLPGFCAGPYVGSMWLIYAGLILGACTTAYYIVQGYRLYRAAKQSECAAGRL